MCVIRILWRRIRKKAALGDLLKYCSAETIVQRYFELPNIFWWLELMPVSWANGMERYSCTSRDLLRRHARCYHVLFIPSNSRELKSVKFVEAFEFIKHINLYNARSPTEVRLYFLRPLSRCGWSSSPNRRSDQLGGIDNKCRLFYLVTCSLLSRASIH